MRKTVLLFAAALLPAWATAARGDTRYHQYTRKFEKPNRPVKILSAGHLGGEGLEWLSGAGFASDGTMVVAGTALKGPLSVGGVKATVVGEDASAPGLDESSLTDRKGRFRPNWKHRNAAGFVAWIAPGPGKVLRVVRLPWKSGAVTDLAVGDDDSVYLVGRAGANVRDLGATDVSKEGAETHGTATFVVKLSKVGKLQWCRAFADAGAGPRIYIRPDGDILAAGGWGYLFSPDGRLGKILEFWRVSGERWNRGINPVDLTCSAGGDSNTGTGREPWRKPRCFVNHLGERPMELYAWNSHLVGVDSLRLVSDSALRYFHYTPDGRTLYMVGWSDGGNSVLERQPYDLRKGVDAKGLGFSSWGAGVLSVAHLIRMDPKTAEVSAKTTWLAYLGDKNKPNGLNVRTLSTGTEGSVLLAGGSAWGLIQTGDKLHDGEPGGPYIAVMTEHLDDLRFSSILPGTGVAEVRVKENWTMTSANVRGRSLALFVCGAGETGKHYDEQPQPAPTVDPVQKTFGGGRLDGYYVLMDLGAAGENTAASAEIDAGSSDPDLPDGPKKSLPW